jgi:poly-gamma-glutamate synthesis protein (capsule biosynthesis protein)
LVEYAATGALAALDLVPLEMRRFQLVRPSPGDAAWLQQRLDRESRRFGVGIVAGPQDRLTLSWQRG